MRAPSNFVSMLKLAQIRILALLGLWIGIGDVPASWASCDLFPGVERTYSSSLGTANRPWAAPGESIEVAHRVCDTEGAPPASQGSDNIVTVAFLDPGMTGASLIVLSDDCDEGLKARVAQCAAGKAVDEAVCLEVPSESLESRENGRFRFPFPDSTRVHGDEGWAGPARIAVSDRSADLPCKLARLSCNEIQGTSICVDKFFQDYGACDTGTRPTTFQHFTALPRPNSFSAGCFQSEEICEASESSLRLAADPEGNLFLPVDWSGILAEQDDFPVPRIVRSVIQSPFPFSIPDEVFVGSFTADGGPLPPIFSPLFDPNGVGSPDKVVFFGSADAPYTILRFARRFGVCTGGSDEGRMCEVDVDCPGSRAICERACAGSPEDLCVRDSDCGAQGPCGELFDPSMLGEGPGVPALPKQPLEIPAPPTGVCQFAQDRECTRDADCSAFGNPNDICVHWALEAGDAVPLDGILETEDLWAFTFEEWLDEVDRNGDGDTDDTVVTIRPRSTGVLQKMELHPACVGSPGGGRSTLRLVRGGFDFPAVVAEGRKVAFLEPEEDFGAGCDMDAVPDGDIAGVALSVAAVGDPEIFVSRWAAVDLAPKLDGNALALSQVAATGNAVAFARFDEAEASADLYPDAVLDDVVLGLVDESGSSEVFCPAGQVATANGKAAFLRPEDPGADGSADCPVGPLNEDGDATDNVVQLLRRDPVSALWRVQNLGLAATAVDLSSSWIAALADEAGQPGVGNGDGDSLDQVLHIRSLAEPLEAQPWINLGLAADRLVLDDDILVFRVSEVAQGQDLNGNAEAEDLLHVAAAGVGGPQWLDPAIDFVLGEEEVLCPGTDQRVRLLAYTKPSDQWAPGAVGLHVFNAAHTGGQFPASVAVEVGQSVYPCDSDACHPDKPFHVQGYEVRFLTDEAEQQEDLDGDDAPDDLVLQIYDFCADIPRTVGAVDIAALDARNPLAPRTSLVPAEVLVQRTGRCMQPVPACPSGDSDCCPRGSSLSRVGQEMKCVYASPTSCVAQDDGTSADCAEVGNGNVSCVARAVSVSVSAVDSDADGEIDATGDCDETGLLGSCVDGAQCRRAKRTSPLATGEVRITDVLGQHDVRVQSIEGACRTAGLAGASVNEGSAVATRWRISEPGFDGSTSLRLKDRFGLHEVVVRKPLRLLRAAQELDKNQKRASLNSNDHLCYQVREIRPEKRSRDLTLAGADGDSAGYQLRRLRQLCLPASIGIQQEVPAQSAWACYRAKLAGPANKGAWTDDEINVLDGFGSHKLRLGADRDICVRAQVSQASLQGPTPTPAPPTPTPASPTPTPDLGPGPGPVSPQPASADFRR